MNSSSARREVITPTPHAPSRIDAGFATTREAAEFLQLSSSMIRKLIEAQKIPAHRFGRLIRIRWSWLRAQADQER